MNELMEIDLRINGPAELQSRHETIREGDTVRVGRSPATGIEIPWDRRISREQADLYFDGSRLHIKCLEGARNPILCGRRAFREVSLDVGTEFRIGETRFTLRESEASTRDSLNQHFNEQSPRDVVEHSYASQALWRDGAGSSERQMEILASLPSIMATAESDDELIGRIVPCLLDGIANADGAMVAQFDNAWLEDTAGPEVLTRPVLIQVKTRANFEGAFRPSRRLILKALRMKQSLVHRWARNESGQKYTVSDGMEWAYCIPLRNDQCRGWCFFVAGHLTRVTAADEAVRNDLRFAELVAEILGATRQIRYSEDKRCRLKGMFAPAVVREIMSQDTREVMQSAECEMTALHCDVRGAGTLAVSNDRNLRGALDSVHEMLNIVVSGILDHHGAISQSDSDTVAGIWGWPIKAVNGPFAACQSSLDIVRSLASGRLPDEGLRSGLSIYIGIAHGDAIAGLIGPEPHVKVGAYGPTVNRGRQLAEWAARFGVDVCLDDVTAGWVQLRLKSSWGRVRRLARVRDSDDETPINAFGLLPSLAESAALTEEMLIRYDSAIDAVIDGEWNEARSILALMPETDRPTQFILRRMAETSNVPPDDWAGVFSLS